jgi:hypothetical protein
MAWLNDFGDLLYVSALKVERLYATLKPSLPSRVSAVSLKVGMGEARVEVRNQEMLDAIAKLPSVSRAIEQVYGVSALDDPDLGALGPVVSEALSLITSEVVLERTVLAF